jgi:hypothetical protein
VTRTVNMHVESSLHKRLQYYPHCPRRGTNELSTSADLRRQLVPAEPSTVMPEARVRRRQR